MKFNPECGGKGQFEISEAREGEITVVGLDEWQKLVKEGGDFEKVIKRRERVVEEGIRVDTRREVKKNRRLAKIVRASAALAGAAARKRIEGNRE